MAKFGLVSKEEDRALEFLFKDHLSAAEAQRRLADEGIQMSYDKVANLKKHAFDKFVEEMREEGKSEFLLQSLSKATLQFDEIYDFYKRIAEKLEKTGDYFQVLVALQAQSKMLNTALKVLGPLKTSVERIQAQNVNILTTADVMSALEQNQNKIFAMGAKIEEGRLVLENPTPELIDAYHSWKFKSGKANARIES